MSFKNCSIILRITYVLFEIRREKIRQESNFCQEKSHLTCCKGCSNVLQTLSHLVQAFTFNFLFPEIP